MTLLGRGSNTHFPVSMTRLDRSSHHHHGYEIAMKAFKIIINWSWRKQIA